MSLIDSHIHLDFPVFDADRKQVVARARAAGVSEFVLPSVAERHWPRLAEVAAGLENGHAAYGLHPCYLGEHADGVLLRLNQWLDSHRAVGIGECGLDFYTNGLDTESFQIGLFDGQIAIANDRSLPLIVHARKAVDRATQRLRLGGAVSGVVHSFSGSWQQACRLIDLGFCLGIGGSVTHTRAQKLRRIVSKLPADAWVLETDAPDQSGALHRGERNEPAFLTEVVEVVAGLRGLDSDAVQELATANARRLFRLDINCP